ncbi:MAG: UvrD-helicase domain-containing protein, partial [Pseudonocardia sp.]
TAEDPLVRHLADVDDAELARRRRRLRAALAQFDAATIATTHGFCQQMLAALGTAGDTEPEATFVERVDDLVTEVVDDLYLRRYVRDPDRPAFDLRTARAIARAAVQDRHATLVEPGGPADSEAASRTRLAAAVRREVAQRKRARRLLDYDDLLTGLRDALTDPERGPAARARIRARYRVVMVDEFQDTDPVQWQVLHSVFAGSTTLVLIGDPKQAVYAFRGADLVTYLSAARTAATHRTLARNWRSDADLVEAIGRLFAGAALGDPDIVVRPVDAEHASPRLSGAGAPLRVRRAGREQVGRPTARLPGAREAWPLVVHDLAADVVSLLGSGAQLAVAAGWRPVRPGDLAVLVRTHDQAASVRQALRVAGVPAVLGGARSVFRSAMAQEWLTLLHALVQPPRGGLARASALTCFVGWSAGRLADTSDDAASDALALLLHDWREVFAQRGVAALLEVVTSTTDLPLRLLGRPGGERDLTDLRHVAQALHAAAVAGRLGPSAVLEWLQRRVADAETDLAEERSQRLESDADAVQVLTVHASKGLEFPVVYLPFAWDRPEAANPDPLRLHADDGTRLLDVGGGSAPGRAQRLARHCAEDRGEELRLLYVATTRAQCQVVTWWVPAYTTASSALHRLQFGAVTAGAQPPERAEVPDDTAVRRRLEAFAAAGGGCVAAEDVAVDRVVRREPPAPPAQTLAAARFDRRLDAAWRRTSYTGLTAAVHGLPSAPAGVGSEPEQPERQDEPPVPAPGPAAAPGGSAQAPAALPDVPSPMADLPSGPAFGTLVHSVLETVDTGAADLPAELLTRCEQAVRDRPGATVDPEGLASALLPVLDTPLGPLAGGRRLRDVPASDRLAELEFELPLAGGDEPRTVDATLADVAALLRHHLAPADPLAGYADALDVPALAPQRLRGYLAGSVDAVLRLHSAHRSRYLVVDYKTNWLGDPSGSPG